MTKKSLFVCSLAALVFAFVWFVQAQEKKKESRLTGEIIDSACYMKMGAKGADHKKCAEECAKGGTPLAFLEDGTGDVYMLAAGEGKDPNSLVKDYIADKVILTGNVYERGGAKMLSVQKIEKVK